jgi:UDP-3-O-[3-hydroxymyristoyl] glucosamine N-acyltransferase
MQVAFSPEEIISMVRAARTLGQTHQTVRGIAALKAAAPGDLSFLGNPKYKPEVAQSQASVVLVPLDYVGEPRPDQLFVLVENPSVALAQVCARIEQSLWPKPTAGVHPSASVAAGAIIPATATVGPLCVVEAGARLGERVHLQAQVFVGRGAVLGDDCWLMPGSIVAAECTLGERVRLQPGAVVGSDGFGYEFNQGRHEKVPQIGTVVIGADVEIGANTCIDRGALDDTVIEDGVKLDNLIQIGHNVHIGAHTAMAGCVGVAGSARIGAHCTIGGAAMILGHLTLADRVNISVATVVTRSILQPGHYSGFFPVDDNASWEKNAATLKHLHSLRDRLKQVEKQIALQQPTALPATKEQP